MTLPRRSLLAAASAAIAPRALASKPRPFPLAICSETFPGAGFPAICESARRTGYTGLEIDPSNLSEDPAALTSAQRASLRRVMKDAGIEYCGLHSILKAPKGLHLTVADAAVRRRSWEYFDRLIGLVADLGPSPVMVLGSGKQRQAIDGVTPGEATRRIIEGLQGLAGHAAQAKVSILVEPLAPHLCNVINSLAEAAAVADAVGNPAIQTMFDTHNTTAETEPLPDLIRRHFQRIRHVHFNELDGRYPGSGSFSFGPVLQTLRDLGYRGWISVEVFDFQPDGETVARLAAEHIRRVEATLK
jgi:sugar phosphate isomerase/epimerase